MSQMFGQGGLGAGVGGQENTLGDPVGARLETGNKAVGVVVDCGAMGERDLDTVGNRDGK